MGEQIHVLKPMLCLILGGGYAEDHYVFFTTGQLLSYQRSRELLIESIQYRWQHLLQDTALGNSQI